MQIAQLTKRLNTRSLDRVFLRLYTISRRYGWTPGKYKTPWFQMIDLCLKYGFRPTFPATATVVQRNPGLFLEAQALGAEFAVHGLRHIDYTHLSGEVVTQHAQRAWDIFKVHGIAAQGFRYPYLRSNAESIGSVKSAGYAWDSSEAFAWMGLQPTDYPERVWSNYQNILSTYDAKDHRCTCCLPKAWDHFVELPVSVPDDDILVERLELKDDRRIERILIDMYRDYRDRDNALILQMHPERYPQIQGGLSVLLEQAASDGVWRTSLDGLADWWQRRYHFNLEVTSGSEGWRAGSPADDRAVIELKDAGGEWMPWNGLVLSSAWKPVAGGTKEAVALWETLLRNEGVAFEVVRPDEPVSVPLSAAHVSPARADLIRLLEDARGPLFRFARWPHGKKAALSVSGDIDGVDLWDFWERFRG